MRSLCFSPLHFYSLCHCTIQCSKVATASIDHTARLWNIGTGECLMSFLGHEDQAGWLGFRLILYLSKTINNILLFLAHQNGNFFDTCCVVSTIFVVTYISQIPEATFFTLRPFGPGLFFPARCELLRKWVLVRTHPLLFQAGEVSWQLRSMCWTEQNGPNKTNITAVFAATFSEILCIVLLPQISKADVGGQAAQLWCRSLFQRKMGQI